MILLIPQVENVKNWFSVAFLRYACPDMLFDWYICWLVVGRLVAGGLMDAGFDDMVWSDVLETSQPAHSSSLHGDPVIRTHYFKKS